MQRPALPQAHPHVSLLLLSAALIAAAGCRGGQTTEDPEPGTNAAGSPSEVESRSQALAGVWTGVNIGNTIAGTSNESGGTFTLEGGGADIWTAADAFRFHYMTVTGNVTLTARVASLENTHAFAKVGVMMRETLAAGAKNAFAVVTSDPANGNRLQYRTTTDGTSSKLQVGTGTKPVYLRLVRSGSTFTASFSTNGSTFTPIGSQTITMANTIEVGLAVTSHDNTQLATAVFDNVIFNPPQTLPNPPANLVATPGNSQVGLTWNASAGATSYTVKRSLTSGGPYTNFTAPGITGTSYTNTGLSNGTAYFYVVTASNSVGESGNSNQATATPVPPGPPSAPANLAATPGNGQVALNWNASSGATSYTVKRSLSSGGPYTDFTATGITGTTFTNTGLSNGTAYFYVVTASNSAGESGNSNQATATPMPPPPPGAPAGLTATPGNMQIALSWSASSGATSYTVKRSLDAGGPYTNFEQTGITGTSYTNTGLTNGTPYYYVVTASNSSGESGNSNEATATPVPPPPPGAPTNLVATAGNAQVALSWSAVGGASSYTVKRSLTNGGPYTNFTQSNITGTSYTNTGLTNGTTYYYVVTAVGAGGESANSNQASATPVAAPAWTSASIGAVAAAGSYTQSGGTYTVRGSGADIYGTADEFHYVYQSISGDATITARVASIQNTNVWAKAGVMIRNGTGAGAQNTFMLVSATDSNGYRWQTRTTSGGSTSSLNVGGGTRPIWFRIVRSGNNFTGQYSSNGTSWSTAGTVSIAMASTVQVGMAVTSHADGTLASGVFDNVSITTPAPPPAPTGVTAAGQNNQVFLSWQAASGATSYTVKQASSSSGPFAVVATGVPDTSYNRTGLANGTTYYFTVAASNSSGSSADSAVVSATPQLLRPSVSSVAPADTATDVATTVHVACEVTLPNDGGGVDSTTLTGNVTLTRISDGTAVAGTPNTTGGGDAVIFQPMAQLAAHTSYRFNLTAGVKDLTGAAFLPFTSTFTTGDAAPPPPTTVAFDRILATTQLKAWTSITWGPDGKVYAGTITGQIYRFNVNTDGTLNNSPTLIDTIRSNNGGNRAVIGMTFDPAATAANLILWVTHGHSALKEAQDWSGKLSKLTGANLQTYQNFVINFPRSFKDHMTNSIAFKGTDSRYLYITQGSMNAMGAPDNAWGQRAEHLMAAAILRVDTQTTQTLPINIQTNDADPTASGYNPFAVGAPVIIYATGVRNAYDLLWHSNGQLYTATNGSAAGGNSPATPSPLPSACSRRVDGTPYTGPSVPGITSNAVAEDDYFYRIVQNGYYGHPNPSRCEWVLNGGNPTSGNDNTQVTAYPVGTQPDRNWRGNAFNFAAHYSPNGMIEWQSTVFPSLNGKILVIRYSGGDDIIVLEIDPVTKNVKDDVTGIPGFGGFTDPLDITYNPANGRVYVTEYLDTAQAHIYLLRPRP